MGRVRIRAKGLPVPRCGRTLQGWAQRSLLARSSSTRWPSARPRGSSSAGSRPGSAGGVPWHGGSGARAHRAPSERGCTSPRPRSGGGTTAGRSRSERALRACTSQPCGCFGRFTRRFSSRGGRSWSCLQPVRGDRPGLPCGRFLGFAFGSRAGRGRWCGGTFRPGRVPLPKALRAALRPARRPVENAAWRL